MRQAERIIQKFGSPKALADALGHKYPTTVRGWLERGYIPSRQIADVLRVARVNGINVVPADFFPEPESKATADGQSG